VAYDRAHALDTYRIVLDEDYPGLELCARRPSFLGEEAAEKAWPVLTDPELTAQAAWSAQAREMVRTAVRLLAGAMADALVSWSLEWDGRPVPCTVDAMLRLDTPFLVDVVGVWVEQVAARPVAVPVEDTPGDEGDEGDEGDAEVSAVLSSIPTLDIPPSTTTVDSDDGETVAAQQVEEVPA
jgi:hypothetical protein